MEKRACAIIPARGGSKAIPRKNVRILAGKPLVAYAIAAARESRWTDRVIVSTDDTEIANVANRHGAQVVWRPKEISGDTASSELAILHALDHLEQTEGYSVPITVFLQCTSPMMTAADIDGTIEKLVETDSDCALAAVPFHYFLWRPEGDCAAGVNHDPRGRLMRQERAPEYLETGAVYAMRTEGFLSVRHRFFGRIALYVSGGPQIEIDELSDFQIAEALIWARESERRCNKLPTTVAALVLDFDGVLTDNHVIVSEDGKESVMCSRSDGYGLSCLRKADIPVLVLSAERNPVVTSRCEKLGISCLQAVSNKLESLKRWCASQDIDVSNVVYVGNDDADVECLREAGIGVAVADAHPSALAAAKMVLRASGGHGAVRELCDLILRQKRRGD